MRVDLRSGAVTVQRYWAPRPQIQATAPGEAATELRRLFLKNIELHMRADVPVGAALSGGIDSSAVVASIRHLYPDAELHTFSYVEPDFKLNEGAWVKQVTDRYPVTSHIVTPQPGDLERDLDELILAQGEPFLSTSIYAQYAVFRSARQHGIPVILDGQGADEQLAGYPIYASARLTSLLRQGQVQRAAQMIRQAGPARRALLLNVAQFLAPAAVQGTLRQLVGEPLQPTWLSADWLRRQGVELRAERVPGGRQTLKEELQRSTFRYPLPSLLRYEDRNSMHFSIESRVPFLTRELAEFLMTLPEELLLDAQGRTKAVFRDAMKGLVPDPILARRDKLGFVTPETRWLIAHPEWVERQLEILEQLEGPVDAAQARQHWQALQTRAAEDSAGPLWRMLNFAAWVQAYQVVL
ncbi:asparagine synthetase B family protein [Deinococcus multiflagellatus]|uniref:asparagine synthase (glutamine-hydrolyzing) n=2 Tax=Deinococcus multiflagellatus TaxID=1656887 RepID=A0ABW1ZL93_9DEIO